MKIYKYTSLLFIYLIACFSSNGQNNWDANSIIVTDDFSNNLPLSNGLGGYKAFYQPGNEKYMGQNSYDELTEIADSLMRAKNYAAAVIKYEIAFKENKNLGKVIHRINAAVCYTQLNKLDNAFFQLLRVAEKGHLSNKYVIADNELLDPLHQDKRWNKVLEIIENNRLNREMILNGQIVNIG
jgi:hypothetical protein